MNIALLQTVHNRLYAFTDPESMSGILSREEALTLQSDMAQQTFSLLEQASPADLYVTTEAVNYPGQPERLPGPYADYVDAGPLLDRFSRLAHERHAYVAAGLYQKDAEGRLYNTLTLFDRTGARLASYVKVHLAGSEQRDLTRGTDYVTVDTAFGRLGLSICWDMQFPEVCRHYALSGARLVICPTWGWESIYSHARAYENGIWIAGAMSVPFRSPIEGIRTPSEVIAPDGSVRAVASRDAAQVLLCRLDLDEMRDLQVLRMHDRRPDTYGRLVTSQTP